MGRKSICQRARRCTIIIMIGLDSGKLLELN